MCPPMSKKKFSTTEQDVIVQLYRKAIHLHVNMIILFKYRPEFVQQFFHVQCAVISLLIF